MLQEFRICIQTHFQTFFGFWRPNRLTMNNTSVYEYQTPTLLPFYKFLKITLLISQPLTYLSSSSRIILDSFLCNTWKICLFIFGASEHNLPCSFYVSQITLWDILFFTVSLFFFSNTYVLYTIRKGFWCRLNRTFVCPSVCLSVRPPEY